MADELPQVGPWARDKLERLGKYLAAYTRILSKQPWLEGYIYKVIFMWTRLLGQAAHKPVPRHLMRFLKPSWNWVENSEVGQKSVIFSMDLRALLLM